MGSDSFFLLFFHKLVLLIFKMNTIGDYVCINSKYVKSITKKKSIENNYEALKINIFSKIYYLELFFPPVSKDFFLSFFFRLHCAACRVLVPWPGIKPKPPALGAQSLYHWIAREVLQRFIFLFPSSQSFQQCSTKRIL